MKIEIEKKYEVQNFPGHLVPFEEKGVWQAYIMSAQAEEIRIRKQLYEGRYICDLTYKKSQDENTRKEHKVSISKQMYDEMVSGDKKEIVKERKFYMENGVQIMVDYYPQLNIYMAEVEFNSQGELDNFEKPHWLGNEINISNKDLIKSLR